ncbi:uncharacterized protein Z518_04689 [Rhinocladiella mackenziei CBS 650.93]|uniref:Uncharacterized protein n=1 Tax=Rhinocladiella mackenziei CBS 650.93 TaxID=1442369 RepID=A0A0D2H8D5_9EURO|nr:uncharacterized protein Z518_04689 [Rhinocladiella mackenziei CBS 650.93]KIX06713.1 hypothetical protein Z518_04689 [Rhinocladiella mackenziei CBS 650.93]
MAMLYKEVKNLSTHKIFIVDFETARRSEKKFTCPINEQDVTNAQFDARRRIRGPPESQFPHGVKTSKQIIPTLIDAGLSPNSIWVEYSTTSFDRKCMEVLIKDAGMPIDSILPPRVRCWTVILDFMRFLPGSDAAVLYDFLQRWINLPGQAEA